MTSKGSLSGRLFRAMLLIAIINAVITLIATELIYEDIEEASLTVSLAEERAYFEKQIAGDKVSSWSSALLTAYFVPEGEQNVELPRLFRGRPVPYSAEVNSTEKTYLISIAQTTNTPGVLYLAQDISILESREEWFQETGFIIFILGMLTISFIIARFGSTRIIRPLQSLSSQIRKIRPDSNFTHISAHYADKELNEIASVLNDLLNALDTYVRREKALVSLASHELRTPIAVISGALDVIDQRGPTDPTNQRTLDRIRQATSKMQADVNALLKLAHHPSAQGKADVVNLKACAHRVVQELESSAPHYRGRVKQAMPQRSTKIKADQTLVHMLMRNLIQNALRHTQGSVSIAITDDRIIISDAGKGLPPHVRARLNNNRQQKTIPAEGLGLFIVSLICERLDWKLEVSHTGEKGTTIQVIVPRLPQSGDPDL